MANNTQAGSTPTLVLLAAAVIILAGVKVAEPIVTPMLLSLFIVAISAPSYFWLLRYKVPAIIALLIVLAVLIIVGFGLSGLIGSSLDGFSQKLPFYQQRLGQVNAELIGVVAKLGIHIEPGVYKNLFDLGAVMGFFGTALNSFVGTLANAFFILLVVAFLLLELKSLAGKVRRISADSEKTLSDLNDFSSTLNRYFVIKVIVSFFTGLTIMIMLSLFGVDYPILWGVLAFLLNFIPNIGSFIAAVPAILMALIQFGFLTAGWVTVVYLVINSLVGNIIEPRLLGRSLGLSSFIVFVSLVFWGWLLGPVGMFLSVPLTITLKIGLESSEQTKHIAVLLGSD
ncbi:MAG: AI-2 transport protein TqsA [Flavobacteriales bacterium]|jgi:AI-2 transport protein TqsA